MFHAWRAEERRPDGLYHKLACGHWKRAQHRRSDGQPVVRQWCSTCSPAPRKKHATLVLNLPRERGLWLRAVLSAGLARDDYHHPEQARALLHQVQRALGKD